MDTTGGVARTLRRQSNTINYSEKLTLDNSSDSGLGDDGDVHRQTTAVTRFTGSPPSLESMSMDIATVQQVPESSQKPRKRVARACDFCRRKKCKVRLSM